MLAGGRAAECGARVLLLEKMPQPGRKVLLSGNGRCNLSNNTGLDDFVGMFGQNGRFLYHACRVFFRDDLVRLLDYLGIATTTESDGRIFPSSNRSSDVVAGIQRYMSNHGAISRTGHAVSELIVNDGSITGVRADAETYDARAVVLATGGMSYPWTGSSGDGHKMAADLGHTVVPLRPALVPLELWEKEHAVAMQGVSLHDIQLTSFSCAAADIRQGSSHAQYGRGILGKRPGKLVIESRRGDLMFTHYGIGGPVTLRESLAIVDALKNGPVSVSIDLQPDRTEVELRRDFQQDLDHHGKRRLAGLLSKWLSGRVAKTILEISGIDGQKLCSRIESTERDRLVAVIKSLRFNIKAPLPISQAMVTAGGVELGEIDPRSMASRIVKGLYFCGEVMDLDAETGGYNLQCAFSTGYLAGQSAASFVSTL